MKVDKIKKTCGLILYIKSILELMATIVLLLGGIALIVLTQSAMDKTEIVNDLDNAIGKCTVAFTGAIITAIGIIYMILACFLGIIAIIYFINARRLLYRNNYQKNATITLLILEILSIIFSFIGVILCGIKLQEQLFLFIICVLLLIQSIITVILLVKYIKENKIQKEM